MAKAFEQWLVNVGEAKVERMQAETEEQMQATQMDFEDQLDEVEAQMEQQLAASKIQSQFRSARDAKAMKELHAAHVQRLADITGEHDAIAAEQADASNSANANATEFKRLQLDLEQSRLILTRNLAAVVVQSYYRRYRAMNALRTLVEITYDLKVATWRLELRG